MAYAIASDMVARYDETVLRDLLSDSGDPVDGDLDDNAKLTAMLDASSGRVDAALMVSGHYTATDLEGLAGHSLALLKDIVCDLAMVRLMRRRPEKIGSDATQAASKEAEEYLDRLRKGDRIFDLPAHKEAGTPVVDGPTALDYQNLNLIPDRTHNFYPSRASRLPIGRQ